MTSFAPSHVGICVSDLDRSMRFYCDGLGFVAAERHEVGSELGHVLEVPGEVKLTSQFIRKGGMSVELLHYDSPGVTGTPSQHRNQLGFTHLSFVVEDVDVAIAHLVAHGGTLLPETRFDVGIGLVFLADPDGTRVELMRFA